MKHSYILLGAILLASCGSKESHKVTAAPNTEASGTTTASSESCKNSDALSDAALNNLNPLVHNYNEYSVMIDGLDKLALDHEATKIQSLKNWARRIKDPCVRSAYDHWLDFYEGQLQSAYQELKTHDLRRGQEAYERKQDADLKASENLAQSLPKPTL